MNKVGEEHGATRNTKPIGRRGHGGKTKSGSRTGDIHSRNNIQGKIISFRGILSKD
jgi:hypothetical protein